MSEKRQILRPVWSGEKIARFYPSLLMKLTLETLCIWIFGILLVAGGLYVPWLEQWLGVQLPMYFPLLACGLAGAALFSGFIAFEVVRFALRPRWERGLRLHLFETNYGRSDGWQVERDGRVMALLVEPQFEEMFWDSYRVEVQVDDPEERRRILKEPGWWLQPGLVFRGRTVGAVASGAFPAGQVFMDSGRILMRGLHFLVEPPDLWERILLWWRKQTRSRRVSPSAPAGQPRQ